MFNLSQIMQAAQGGQAIQNLAAQFGLPPEQAQQAVDALLPALSAGLKNQISEPSAVGPLMSAIGDPQHQAAFKGADAAQSDDAQMAGQQTFNQIVGGEDAATAIAQKAAEATGLSPELLQQMLPQVTSVAMGGVMTAMQKRGYGGLADKIGEMANSGGLASAVNQAASGSSGGWTGLVGGLVGSLFGGSSTGTQNEQSAASGPVAEGVSALTQLFDHGAGSDAAQLEQKYASIIGGAQK